LENKLFFEVQKKWKEVGNYKPIDKLQLEVELYKKLLDIFQVGDFYFFIFAPPLAEIEYVSDTISRVIGYDRENFTIESMMNIIHPDDLPHFIDFESRVVEFKKKLPADKIMKYKSQYPYRIRKADGKYISILQQSITIQSDEDSSVLRNFVVHTDISSFKNDAKMSLSFIGLEGEPTFHNVKENTPLIPFNNILTNREIQIFNLIAQNLTTAEIADILNISIATVGTHRKNIHRKTGTHSALELINHAMENGWVY